MKRYNFLNFHFDDSFMKAL